MKSPIDQFSSTDCYCYVFLFRLCRNCIIGIETHVQLFRRRQKQKLGAYPNKSDTNRHKSSFVGVKSRTNRRAKVLAKCWRSQSVNQWLRWVRERSEKERCCDDWEGGARRRVTALELLGGCNEWERMSRDVNPRSRIWCIRVVFVFVFVLSYFNLT